MPFIGKNSTFVDYKYITIIIIIKIITIICISVNRYWFLVRKMWRNRAKVVHAGFVAAVALLFAESNCCRNRRESERSATWTNSAVNHNIIVFITVGKFSLYVHVTQTCNRWVCNRNFSTYRNLYKWNLYLGHNNSPPKVRSYYSRQCDMI